MTDRMIRSAAAALLLGYAVSAGAQWAWRDDGGRLVFSDRPPPASVKPSQIVRQPATAAPSPSSAPVYVIEEKPAPAKAEAKAEAKAATKKADAPAPAAPKTLAERDMDFRKRTQERAEADKKASEEQARRQQIAQDCERSRGYLRALEDGRRVARTDAQGNQVVLDDAARADELARLRERIASTCNQ
jgi:hypothetical protein